MTEIVGGILVLLFMVLLSGIKTVREYHRLVIYRLGRVDRCVGPGLQFMIPILERAEIVDTRAQTILLPLVEESTHDGFIVRVSAVCSYQIADAKKAILKVSDVHYTTSQTIELAVRRAVEQHDLRAVLTDRTRVNWTLKTILEKQVRDWGVKILSVDIKEVKLTRETKKALVHAKKIDTGEFVRMPGEFKIDLLEKRN